MTILSAKIKGLDALKARLASLPDLARAGAEVALLTTAETAAADLRATLQPGSGSSAPGEAPSDPEGRIAAAVTAGPDESGGASLTVALPFARDLEFGTTKMAARPFLRPAAQRTGSDARSTLVKVVAATLKGPIP